MQKRIPIGGRPLRATDFVLVMDVTNEPVRATGACQKSAYKAGPGIRWTLVGSEVYEVEHQIPGEEVPPRLRLIFEVEVVGEHHSDDSRLCHSRFEFETPRRGPSHRVVAALRGPAVASAQRAAITSRPEEPLVPPLR